jgi:hypothetical protein
MNADTPADDGFYSGPPQMRTSDPALAAPPSAARKAVGDRFAVLNAFVDCSLAVLDNASDVKVWLILFRDTKTGVARTSQADLARRAGVTDRTVRNSLGRLEKLGLVQVTHQGGLPNRTSAYRVVGVTADGQSGERGTGTPAEGRTR